MWELAPWVITMAVLVGASALFSATEAALFSLEPAEAARLKHGKRAARLAERLLQETVETAPARPPRTAEPATIIGFTLPPPRVAIRSAVVPAPIPAPAAVPARTAVPVDPVLFPTSRPI